MKTLVLEYWTPLVVWLLTIFVVSTDSFSANETSQFLVPLLMFLFPGLSPQELGIAHAVIRKLAHVGAYFMLAILTYRTFRHQERDLVRARVGAGVFVLASALLDEFHQSFTASRGASIVDVGYDCLGAVWAFWLITTYETRRIRSYSIL